MHDRPRVVSLSQEIGGGDYDNHIITATNDHVVRISTMRTPYQWHVHPNSDETFLVIEGVLAIEFRDAQFELRPGDALTVPKGVEHRTRPAGDRSVNVTFERLDSATEFCGDT